MKILRRILLILLVIVLLLVIGVGAFAIDLTRGPLPQTSG